jgi:hypothetical protein
MFYLLDETVTDADGTGPVFELGSQPRKLLIVTVGISSLMQSSSLLISIWGSVDGQDWGLTPVVSFAPKLSCGFYSTKLNLVSNPDVSFLRVAWCIGHWRKNQEPSPCGFHVFLEPSGARVSAAV